MKMKQRCPGFGLKQMYWLSERYFCVSYPIPPAVFCGYSSSQKYVWKESSMRITLFSQEYAICIIFFKANTSYIFLPVEFLGE